MNDKLQAQTQHYPQIKVLGNAIISLPLIGLQGSVIQTLVFCHCRQYRVTHPERASFSIKCKNHRETWWYLVYAISSSAVRILWEKILTPSSWQLLSILNLTVVFQYGFEPPSTEKTLGILIMVCETHVHISFHLQHYQDNKLHTAMTPTQNSIVVLGYSWGFYTLPISSQMRSI